MLVLLIIGIICCFLSTADNSGKADSVPNFQLLCIGWFITSFSLIHFYLGSFRQFIKRRFLYKSSNCF
jgi:hypothetical protein